MLSILADGAEQLGIKLSQQQLERFETYFELLTDWAERVSLTAVKDSEGVQRRHFLESAALIPILDGVGFTTRERSIIDIGTGAGIPGIPLKIIEPSLKLTLVESKARKTEFLHALLPALGMTDVTVVARRSEEVARDPRHREQYDLCVAKALASMNTLVELTLPFLRMGGIAVCPKGKGAEKELAEAKVALEVLHGSVRAVEPLPLADQNQTVILIDKELPTPPRFPRRPGVPAKRPLY
jgi:16S rRNA (guanine527-N7)-methyltransferase